MPTVTVVAVWLPGHIAGIEVEAPRAERVVRIERRRPVVADGTRIAEIRVDPATGSRKEYTVPVGRFNQHTVDSAAIVVRYPSPGTLFE